MSRLSRTHQLPRWLTVILIIALLVNAPSFEISRLFTFKDYTGDAGGGVWAPASDAARKAKVAARFTCLFMTHSPCSWDDFACTHLCHSRLSSVKARAGMSKASGACERG